MQQSPKQPSLSAETQAMVDEALDQPGGEAGTVAFLTERAKDTPEVFMELLGATLDGAL